ncbi:MAG TPA: alpha-galactosidase, partial [Tepidisphaeraceae bacterium]|nr:alpha-galactosidase [Tepidisphaeraceae bacterium]
MEAKHRAAIFLFCILAISLPARADEPLTVQTPTLKLTVDAAKGVFALQSLRSNNTFVPTAQLSGGKGRATVFEPHDTTFGKGAGIEVVYPNGAHDQLALYPDLPFLLIRSVMHNDTKSDARVTSIRPFAATINLGKPPADLRALSTAGLTPADHHPGGYEWIAVADPQTRHGVVAGWLTHDRGSGVMFCNAAGNQVTIQPQLDYGRLRIQAGQEATTETLAIGYFDDARLGLEAWADAVAKVYHVHLPPKPVGYCTWYSDKHGGASDEKSLAMITAFAAKELAPFGFSLIQIDDGWQEGVKHNGPKKVFTEFNPKGPYPSGMKATAQNITRDGLTPGIWFMPFAGTFDDPFFKDHQDWFAKTEDGKPFVSSWGGTSLDMTQATARLYLR